MTYTKQGYQISTSAKTIKEWFTQIILNDPNRKIIIRLKCGIVSGYLSHSADSDYEISVNDFFIAKLAFSVECVKRFNVTTGFITLKEPAL